MVNDDEPSVSTTENTGTVADSTVQVTVAVSSENLYTSPVGSDVMVGTEKQETEFHYRVG